MVKKEGKKGKEEDSRREGRENEKRWEGGGGGGQGHCKVTRNTHTDLCPQFLPIFGL